MVILISMSPIGVSSSSREPQTIALCVGLAFGRVIFQALSNAPFSCRIPVTLIGNHG